MYSDVSVTVSSSIVRVFDKAYTILVSSSVEGGILDVTKEQYLVLTEAALLIYRLFLWNDDALGDAEEWDLLLCHKLGWYREVQEFVDDMGLQGISRISQTSYNIVSTEAIDIYELDDLMEFLLLVTDSIWNHFITKHLRVVN